mmetsp:Transcript_8677/g.18496  ORF Transcript_8677/g.18496 Transcript_8677/m.18496 type:complete len:94 (-) Transcript_8677:690-971(-)
MLPARKKFEGGKDLVLNGARDARGVDFGGCRKCDEEELVSFGCVENEGACGALDKSLRRVGIRTLSFDDGLESDVHRVGVSENVAVVGCGGWR